MGALLPPLASTLYIAVLVLQTQMYLPTFPTLTRATPAQPSPRLKPHPASQVLTHPAELLNSQMGGRRFKVASCVPLRHQCRHPPPTCPPASYGFRVPSSSHRGHQSCTLLAQSTSSRGLAGMPAAHLNTSLAVTWRVASSLHSATQPNSTHPISSPSPFYLPLNPKEYELCLSASTPINRGGPFHPLLSH